MLKQIWVGGLAVLMTLSGCLFRSGAEEEWVSRIDGSIQCDADAVYAQDRAKAVLEKQGVTVLESRAASQPKNPFQIQVCGQPTGTVFYFKVRAEDVQNALAVGFTRESSPPNVEGELGD